MMKVYSEAILFEIAKLIGKENHMKESFRKTAATITKARKFFGRWVDFVWSTVIETHFELAVKERNIAKLKKAIIKIEKNWPAGDDRNTHIIYKSIQARFINMLATGVKDFGECPSLLQPMICALNMSGDLGNDEVKRLAIAGISLMLRKNAPYVKENPLIVRPGLRGKLGHYSLN